MVGLAPGRAIVGDAEPVQIFQYRLLEFGSRPTDIDVFDAQQQPAFHAPRRPLVEQRAIGMPQMQKAIGRRCESKYFLAHATSADVTSGHAT